ncbi:MAG: 30S ribosomal protein S7 [Proteobacteria bacterium]|nr:MAG: 30S ribosomal protein S7 [Pseudomonadota bacterium]
MGRKSFIRKREILPDPKFNDVMIAKFINSVMIQGKRALAESVVYSAIDYAANKGGDEGVKVFKKCLENLKPILEVKSRRVGGATYQVPVEVKPARRQSLASRWLIDAARARPENSMAERLGAEIVEAAAGRGTAMKKREDTHKMAEANKAFAHYRW